MGDFKARVFEKHFDGSDVEFNGKALSVQFVGLFNVYNLLAVYGAALMLGMEEEEVLRVLTLLTPVAGRFETIRSSKGVTAIVDYAHTPDALTNVLDAIHEVLQGRQSPYRGGAGQPRPHQTPSDGHRGGASKRPGALHSDNPRFEEPEAILQDMLDGLSEEQQGSVLTIVDRREAIKTACLLAKPGDVVLIAGKGHEDYQEVKGVRYPFDDRVEVVKVFQMLDN